MNPVKKTSLKLTITYSLVFFIFIWVFSAGIYFITHESFGSDYVRRINELANPAATASKTSVSEHAALVASDVALDRLRNVIIVVNGLALVIIPYISYQLSRRAIQPLIFSQKSQRDFIANASHELRTPIAIISGELELALLKERSKNDYLKTIKSAKIETTKMGELVHNLLLLSRLLENKDTMERITVDVTNMLHELLPKYRIPIAKKNITILIPKTTYTLHANQELLSIALSNLLDNAVKFSRDNGEVSIVLTNVKNKLNIVITNQTDSLDPDKIAHLFDRFYQTNEAHATTGYGLGLSIVSQIADLHNGTVQASVSDGRAAFTLILPRG